MAMTQPQAQMAISLADVAGRITALIYQAPIDSPARARFTWQGYQVHVLVPEPHIAAIELCLGHIPFSIENRLLRAELLEMLEVAAIDLQVGLRIAPGGALWVTAACTSAKAISFERMITLASLNLLTLRPIMAYLGALLLVRPKA
jgi:hypothetical protein